MNDRRAPAELTLGPAYEGKAGCTRTESLHLRTTGGALRAVQVYRVVNVRTHRELRDEVLQGRLNRLADGSEIAVPFVYHDPVAFKFALVVPPSLAHLELRERAQLMTELAEDREHLVPAYVREGVTVLGIEELAKYLGVAQPSGTAPQSLRQAGASSDRSAQGDSGGFFANLVPRLLHPQEKPAGRKVARTESASVAARRLLFQTGSRATEADDDDDDREGEIETPDESAAACFSRLRPQVGTQALTEDDVPHAASADVDVAGVEGASPHALHVPAQQGIARMVPPPLPPAALKQRPALEPAWPTLPGAKTSAAASDGATAASRSASAARAPSSGAASPSPAMTNAPRRSSSSAPSSPSAASSARGLGATSAGSASSRAAGAAASPAASAGSASRASASMASASPAVSSGAPRAANGAPSRAAASSATAARASAPAAGVPPAPVASPATAVDTALSMASSDQQSGLRSLPAQKPSGERFPRVAGALRPASQASDSDTSRNVSAPVASALEERRAGSGQAARRKAEAQKELPTDLDPGEAPAPGTMRLRRAGDALRLFVAAPAGRVDAYDDEAELLIQLTEVEGRPLVIIALEGARGAVARWIDDGLAPATREVLERLSRGFRAELVVFVDGVAGTPRPIFAPREQNAKAIAAHLACVRVRPALSAADAIARCLEQPPALHDPNSPFGPAKLPPPSPATVLAALVQLEQWYEPQRLDDALLRYSVPKHVIDAWFRRVLRSAHAFGIAVPKALHGLLLEQQLTPNPADFVRQQLAAFRSRVERGQNDLDARETQRNWELLLAEADALGLAFDPGQRSLPGVGSVQLAAP